MPEKERMGNYACLPKVGMGNKSEVRQFVDGVGCRNKEVGYYIHEFFTRLF